MSSMLQSLAAILWLIMFLVFAVTVALPLEIASRLVSKYRKLGKQA